MKSQNEHHYTENPFFKSWAEILLRWRWPVLALLLIATVFLVGQAATKLQADTSTESFMASDSEPAMVLAELRNEFGMDSYFQILIEGPVFTETYLRRLEAFHQDLESINLNLPSLNQHQRESGIEADSEFITADELRDSFQDTTGWGEESAGSIVDEITSLINVRHTHWREESLHVAGLMDEWPRQEQLPAFKEMVLSNPQWVGRVVGEEGHHSVIIVKTPSMSEEDSGLVYEEIARVASTHSSEGFGIHIAGLPAINATLNVIMQRDVGGSMGLCLLLMLSILILIFRHPLGVAGPFLVVIQALIWTFGTMAMLGISMSMVMNAMPAFLICVGICDAIHIQSVYRDFRKEGVSNHDAIVRAVAVTGIPVFFTSLTTCVGLLSFQLAELAAIQSLGIVAGFGVAIAFLMSVVFLPIVLSFNKTSTFGAKPNSPKGDWIDRFLALCHGLSRPTVTPDGASYLRRNTVLVLGCLVSIAAFVGTSQLQVRHDPLEWMPANSPVRVAFEKIDEHLGGSSNVDLLVSEVPGSSLKSKDVLMTLQQFEEHILAYEDHQKGRVVSHVTSLLDVVRETGKSLFGNDPEYYRIPPEEGGAANLLALFENESPDQLRQLATMDMKKTLMRVRVKWLDAASYAPLTQHIQNGIDNVADGAVKIQATGTVFNIFSVVRRIISDLIRSFGTAFIVITFMIIAMLRSTKLGLIAIVPNLLPIAMVLGGMGYLDIPLDGMNLLIASISIGIAVDDTIHFHHAFQSHYNQHQNVEAALSESFAHTGRALVITSLLLVAGFSVFLNATLFNVQRFGLLIMASTVFALLADLILSPALLRTFYKPSASTLVIPSEDHVHRENALGDSVHPNQRGVSS